MHHTFEETNLHLPTGSAVAFVLVALLNLGALVGGLYFGALSERIGRRKAMMIVALLAIPVIPLWMCGGSLILLGLGAFLIQVMVQGAWGVVQTHLNELAGGRTRHAAGLRLPDGQLAGGPHRHRANLAGAVAWR